MELGNFQISDLVSARQNGNNVTVFACGPRQRRPVTISPDEARELADALIAFADEASRAMTSRDD